MPDQPYQVISISFACILLYAVTIVLARAGMISSAFQRKLWNVALLVCIAVAGGLGVFLAVAINMKWDIPVPDTLLHWHVDFGVALFLVAVFHFSYHVKYYTGLFSANRKNSEITDKQSDNLSPESIPALQQTVLPAFMLGFTAMASQLVLLREFISVFSGNEFVIGIVLAAWMLLTSLGTHLARKGVRSLKPGHISIVLVLMSVAPMAILMLLDASRNLILPTGGIPGPLYMLSASIVLLSPFCLLSGWLFSAVSVFAGQSGTSKPVSLVYALETAGSIVAGVLFSLVLFFFFEPFQNISFMLLANACMLAIWRQRQKPGIRNLTYLLAALVIIALVAVFNVDKLSQKFLFPAQQIVKLKDTPYGKLVVTEREGQLNFYENNTLLATSNNIIESEEAVHYNMLQRLGHGNVLMVGGGLSGAVGECLKYPVNRIDYADVNPAITGLGTEFGTIRADSQLQVLQGDPRLLVAKMASTSPVKILYSSILLNVPEPSTLQSNRFYTLEFFRNLKKIIVPGGVVSISLMPTTDYMGTDSRMLQSAVFGTLKTVFKNVLVIAGEKNYFLASDSLLTSQVAGLAEAKGIDNQYVNQYYLDDASLKERSDDITSRIIKNAPLNCDFKPVGCYHQLRYWMSYTGRYALFLLLLPVVVMMIIGAFRADSTSVALFSAGFMSFSLELSLILAFQVLYGYVYLLTGVFITLFMAGLAAGTFLARKKFINPSRGLMTDLHLAIAIILALTALVLLAAQHDPWPQSLIWPAFIILLVATAFFTGIQFHVASTLRQGHVAQVAASAYSADILGSAAGSVIVNVWLIPAYGFVAALLIVVITALAGWLILRFSKK